MSVIVPFYNVESYAAQTLRSLAVNAAPGIEFVLVDDGSSDATPAILAEAVDHLPGATLVTQPRNRGLAAARNTGMAASKGRYLTFLDGDDVAAAGYFPALLAAITELGCDFVRTDHVQVRGRERSVHRVPYGPRGVVAPPRRGIGGVGHRSSVDAPNAWAGVCDRRLLDSGVMLFDERLRTCEDRPWIWQLHLHAESFAVVSLLGVRYRREVAASLTQIADERQFDYIPAFEGIIAAVRADREAERFMPKALRSYCAMVCHHINQLDRYETALGQRLVALTAASLGRLPTAELDEAVARLDPERAQLVRELRSAA
ncbi:MAG TPA: glycosyltransferase family 2 protein [Propionibacteriaceae bacterium]